MAILRRAFIGALATGGLVGLYAWAAEHRQRASEAEASLHRLRQEEADEIEKLIQDRERARESRDEAAKALEEVVRFKASTGRPSRVGQEIEN